MGPFRRGLIAAILVSLPLPAWAEVCDKVRPGWDGTPVSAWQEALWIMGSPASLVLLVASALVIRFRHAWGGLAVFVGWSFLVSAFTIYDPTDGMRAQASAEGCIGSPTLFIATVAVIAIGILLYTGKPAADAET